MESDDKPRVSVRPLDSRLEKMKTLILMRHAKSDWSQSGLADHDRPLNQRGKRAAPAMAEHARDAGLRVDVILASSAVRVQETVDLLRQQWAEGAELMTCRSLYLASPQQIMQEVNALHASWQSALVVAHNPGISALASILAARAVEMPTAAMAVFRITTDSWQVPLSSTAAELLEFWKPKELSR